jgi:hypothetical protein
MHTARMLPKLQAPLWLALGALSSMGCSLLHIRPEPGPDGRCLGDGAFQLDAAGSVVSGLAGLGWAATRSLGEWNLCTDNCPAGAPRKSSNAGPAALLIASGLFAASGLYGAVAYRQCLAKGLPPLVPPPSSPRWLPDADPPLKMHGLKRQPKEALPFQESAQPGPTTPTSTSPGPALLPEPAKPGPPAPQPPPQGGPG